MKIERTMQSFKRFFIQSPLVISIILMLCFREFVLYTAQVKDEYNYCFFYRSKSRYIEGVLPETVPKFDMLIVAHIHYYVKDRKMPLTKPSN